MNAGLYSPIPDIDAYLRRLGIKRAPETTIEFLFDLIYAHQTKIAFENIDIFFFKKAISLETDHLFDKIVTRGRGGFCFELNALFYSLLKALGYRVTPCRGRSLLDAEWEPSLHRFTLVHFDHGDYYCDVGLGGAAPPGPLRFEADTIQTIRDERFTMRQDPVESQALVLYRFSRDGTEVPLAVLDPTPQRLEEFIPLCHYVSCHEQRLILTFTDNLIINIRKEDGHCSITNDVFVKNASGVCAETELADVRQFLECLRGEFDINADDLDPIEDLSVLRRARRAD